jgi:hypothetical protein
MGSCSICSLFSNLAPSLPAFRFRRFWLTPSEAWGRKPTRAPCLRIVLPCFLPRGSRSWCAGLLLYSAPLQYAQREPARAACRLAFQRRLAGGWREHFAGSIPARRTWLTGTGKLWRERFTCRTPPASRAASPRADQCPSRCGCRLWSRWTSARVASGRLSGCRGCVEDTLTGRVPGFVRVRRTSFPARQSRCARRASAPLPRGCL